MTMEHQCFSTTEGQDVPVVQYNRGPQMHHSCSSAHWFNLATARLSSADHSLEGQAERMAGLTMTVLWIFAAQQAYNCHNCHAVRMYRAPVPFP